MCLKQSGILTYGLFAESLHYRSCFAVLFFGPAAPLVLLCAMQGPFLEARALPPTKSRMESPSSSNHRIYVCC